jgi:hypothetical protein
MKHTDITYVHHHISKSTDMNYVKGINFKESSEKNFRTFFLFLMNIIVIYSFFF